MLKMCTKCGRDLPLSEYLLVHPARKDGKLRPDCKRCVREIRRAQYADDPKGFKRRIHRYHAKAVKRARKLVSDYLANHACVDCGEDDPVVLDFDHVKGKKVADVSRMVGVGYRLSRIEEEIRKCDIRCANCHRRVTVRRRLSSKR